MRLVERDRSATEDSQSAGAAARMSGVDGFEAALDAYAFDHAGDALDPSWEPESDGAHEPCLELTVEGWDVEGETIEERNARLRARDAATRQADRPGGTASDPSPIPRPRRRELHGGQAGASLGVLELDAVAVRAFIRERAPAAGFGADELLARPARGKPTVEAKRRRLALAAILLEARDRGALIETLAAASSRSISTVHELLSEAKRARSA